MENIFHDKVEDNAVVRIWSEKMQLEKGDSLAEGYTSELWDFTWISVTQNELQELRDIWASWGDETKQLFYKNFGDLPYLLDSKVDKKLFWAITQFWNPAYNCFTFGNVDLVPTVEEYTTLLLHPDTKKKVDVFTLNIYGLVIFPKALRHIDEAVVDLFDRLGKGGTPVPAILAETFRSLSAYRKAGKGRFIGCAQLLSILYRCESFEWVHLPEIWRAVGYAPFLVLRQYRSRQFIPITHELTQSKFSYRGNHYKKRVLDIVDAWR
ncbi:hypothetical protein CXB51_036809 [Gossypium anomalum]|uniref:DUF7745 domain-containing protein n=1 Tax=Gossypium anomalum TaxID=47600 RepID=A0A8J5Y3W6_9ROSI|nr:hypothetical protein CXB51_036809 [Gossypium anomalum]